MIGGIRWCGTVYVMEIDGIAYGTPYVKFYCAYETQETENTEC